MRYGFIQRLMWTGFKGTFRKQLSKSFDERNPAEVIKNASKKYRKILRRKQRILVRIMK